MSKALAEQICKRLDALKALRSPHEQVWQDCFDYTYPLRGSGFNSNTANAQQGQAKRAEILDSTATDSVRILASSIMSGLTPANSRWFQLDVGDESEDERRWLDDSAQVLWENIHMANFDASAFEAVIDVSIAGWFALYIEEDKVNGGLRFQQWALPSVYASSTQQGSNVDTVYRCYTLTAEQAVIEFGDDVVSADTLKLSKTKPDEKIQFVHAIYPRGTYAVDAKLAKNLKFASVNIEVKAKLVVRESGYHELPVIVPRWFLIPDSAYGIGPVFDALPDVKMLNELKRMSLAAADIAIAGMWIAEDDGVLNPRTVKIGPRKIIIANSVDSMKPLQTGSNFQLSETMTQQLQNAIRKVLMADQLQPQDGPAMTATEVHIRVNLIRQLLGPIYGRFQAEYLQPLIDRCFGLAYRAGVFSTAPDTLQGREFSVKYISPLARAQKMDDVTAIERLSVNIAQVAQVNPSVLDLIDEDETVRILADALGVPNKVVRKTADVQQLRQQRAEEQKAAQQQQAAMQMQQTAGEAAIKKTINGG